jgi:hypothetical protein
VYINVFLKGGREELLRRLKSTPLSESYKNTRPESLGTYEMSNLCNYLEKKEG